MNEGHNASSETKNRALPKGGSGTALSVRVSLKMRVCVKEATVYDCQRCKGDHDSLSFFPLDNQPDHFTHFATCPTTLQPILVRISF
jgi:hypothetical protein